MGKKAASLRGEPLDLTTMEFETLALLSSRAATVLTRDEILDHLRGIDWEAYNRSIDVVVSRLRQKLHDDPKHPTFLKTVWGSGYMFIARQNREAGENVIGRIRKSVFTKLLLILVGANLAIDFLVFAGVGYIVRPKHEREISFRNEFVQLATYLVDDLSKDPTLEHAKKLSARTGIAIAAEGGVNWKTSDNIPGPQKDFNPHARHPMFFRFGPPPPHAPPVVTIDRELPQGDHPFYGRGHAGPARNRGELVGTSFAHFGSFIRDRGEFPSDSPDSESHSLAGGRCFTIGKRKFRPPGAAKGRRRTRQAFRLI